MIEILTHPKNFTKKNSNCEPKLKTPFVIVLSISLLSGASGVFILQRTLHQIPESIRSFFLMSSNIGLIFGIAGGIVGWVIMTAFFHIPAILMNGEGDYRKLLELVGYAQLPLIFSSAIAMVMIASFTPDLSVEMIQNKAAVERAFLSIPVFKVSRIFGRLMLFWSLFLSAIAVREVHKISDKKAAASVLIPIILYVGLTGLINRWIGVG